VTHSASKGGFVHLVTVHCIARSADSCSSCSGARIAGLLHAPLRSPHAYAHPRLCPQVRGRRQRELPAGLLPREWHALPPPLRCLCLSTRAQRDCHPVPQRPLVPAGKTSPPPPPFSAPMRSSSAHPSHARTPAGVSRQDLPLHRNTQRPSPVLGASRSTISPPLAFVMANAGWQAADALQRGQPH
jgi:hypothetical protein